jgi:hypothetical protein
MYLGVFENLPDELIEKICFHDHNARMQGVFEFLRKYVKENIPRVDILPENIRKVYRHYTVKMKSTFILKKQSDLETGFVYNVLAKNVHIIDYN